MEAAWEKSLESSEHTSEKQSGSLSIKTELMTKTVAADSDMW